MRAVWGAPTHWVQYVGLFSSIGLAAGSVVMFISPGPGQKICAFAIIGMGAFFVPASVSVVPSHWHSGSMGALLIEFGYAAIATTAFYYPVRMKDRVMGLSAILVAMVGTIAVTGWDRWRDGEYDRPFIICFKVAPAAESLVIPQKFSGLIPGMVQSSIQKAGVRGRLIWSGSVDESGQESKMVVIATSRITKLKSLFYPKHGTIVYVWNGTDWSALPSGVEVYPSFATVTLDGMINIQHATGGVSGFGMFHW